MRDETIKRLVALRDEKYQKFHSGLCPGTENIIGVRTPEVRKLAREILRGDYEKFLAEVQNEYYEETLLEGFVIAGAKVPLMDKLVLTERFVPKIDNWAVCDMVCGSFKFRPEELGKVWEFIMQYRRSEREFELRFMLVMMMDYFLTDGHIARVLEIANAVKSEAYYVEMAQAWLIATAFAKQREKTLAFLKQNELLNWVQNKAIQKIRESYRVSAKDKKLVLEYRR